jgi:hypothetical protein
MSRDSSGLIQLLLVAVMSCGGWLALGSGPRFLAGSILVLAALAGLVYFARRKNARPLDGREAEVWEGVRERGRRSYIRRAVIMGLIMGAGSSSVAVFGRGGGVSFGARDIGLFVALVAIITFACYYAAVRIWDVNEQRGKRL